MSVDVNPPPQLRIPKKFQSENELRSYFDQIQRILFQLWKRTGGSTDLVDQSQQEVREFDDLFGFLAGDTSFLERPVSSQSSDYTTAEGEVVECAAEITVFLNAEPDDQELTTVKITTFDTTIDGNGRNINSDTDVLIIADDIEGEASLDFLYSVVFDKWIIV